jgi:uncharacterized protein (DUF4415 family)
MKRKAASKRRFKLNSPAEEARIQAGIKADPDARELTPEDFARMRRFREVMEERRRGRPKSAVHKTPIMVRLDPHILEFFRSGGPGWHPHERRARGIRQASPTETIKVPTGGSRGHGPVRHVAVRWCPRSESNRHAFKGGGFSCYFGFRRRALSTFVVWSTPSP